MTTIAVVGPGAVGATFAALLHQAGHAVSLFGRSPRDPVEVRPDESASAGDPISLRGPVHTGPVRTDPEDVTGPVDVVILAVKATQNAGAEAWLRRLCDENTVVCVAQNGVEQVEQVSPLCPGSAVVPAIVWFSAETQPQGWVRLRTGVRIVLPHSPAAERLAPLLREAGIATDLDTDFTTAAWRKLLVNAVAGLMVLTGRRAGMFRRDDLAALSRRYLAECLDVARAEGATLPDAVVDEVTMLFSQASEDLTTSMLTDREAGRELEWDVRNGVVARRAATHGMSTPISDMLLPLLAAASDGPG